MLLMEVGLPSHLGECPRRYKYCDMASLQQKYNGSAVRRVSRQGRLRNKFHSRQDEYKHLLGGQHREHV